jgi:dipeptidyl aminopeptidase/acylaminoacyl peptidase
MSGELPYGAWPSPITAEALVEQAVRLAYLSYDEKSGRPYWIEGRPSEAGREVLVTASPAGGVPEDVVPAGFSVRTQVHEYGGRCYATHGDLIVFSSWADQRLWTIDGSGPPTALTAEPAQPRSVRYADPVISPDGRWVVCVRETHRSEGPVTNDLVAIALDRPGADPAVVAAGHDFYSAPRLSPDGSRLCWIQWDQPNMPWDSTELYVADFPAITNVVQTAGGPGESVTQPRWSPSGVLHYVSDRTGWWNLYDESGAALCPMEAEFAEPDWVFGNTSYGFGADGALVATWSGDGRGQLGLVHAGRAEPWSLPFTDYSYLAPAGSAVFAIAASPSHPAAVVRLSSDGVEVIKASRQVTLDPAHFSLPEAIEFPTGGGDTAHALFYPPAHPECTGPAGERPPVLVVIHGGPTSATTSALNLAVQYWTSRGIAVVDVDYRGSSGYGRAYRGKLDRAWGIADVEDCAAVIAWLDAQGRVDGQRALIRGGSAGGFTTLAALAFTDRFAAGASHYGVADLELLARDTHKFEARYLDSLVGSWPEEAEEYKRRSPIYHVDRITNPLILFQGLDDKVVPPEQAEIMFGALRDRGVPVAYLPFEGEQHGFRKAETVIEVMLAELEFYGRVLGFTPAGPRPNLPIQNEERLPPRY